MSGFTATNSAWAVNLHSLRVRVQESLDHGFDDNEEGIGNLVRYYVNHVSKVNVSYMPSCRLYSVWFSTVTEEMNPYTYEYRFFVKAHQPRTPPR